MTEFRLLGPLEALVEGRPADLPRGKPRALLARLLLDAGRVVAVETLVESIWERPPPSAHKVLQAYVSQLRKAIGAARIETRPPGYLLRASRDEVDLGRFETLAEVARATGDPARRMQLLGDALALWRGPGLVEFRSEPFARAAARRLAELRLGALEERIEAELERGRHERLVGELETLVAQEPLRERLRRQLMVALYRSGRQADALARYREGRRVLVEELGLEPSPELQELERAILRHDPALERPRTGRARSRGCVICAGAGLEDLVAPLAGESRELVLVELVDRPAELGARAAALARARESLIGRGIETRTVCFTSTDPTGDLARLAAEQEAELLAVGDALAPDALETLLASASCDVAVAPRSDLLFEPAAPVLVPFGGGREEWAALEVGAWLARAHGLPLRLLGAEATDGRRDASRMLASASLALQRFAATVAEPVLVARGAEGILEADGSVVVASLPAGQIGETRRALVERTSVPILLVRGGLRPGGLAPDQTMTRFSWSLGDDAGAAV
jgi:DNA-binding SARP family transcriptional activator